MALLVSLVLNLTILTVAGVYTAATTALNAVGVTTVAAREARETLARHTAVAARKAAAETARRDANRRIGRTTAKNVTRRVQRGAARNILSVGGEAIPLLGVAVIAGALTLEVKDACDTAAEMAGLDAALAADSDPEAARQAAIEAFDCTAMIREEIPSYENVPTKEEIWDKVKSAPREAYNAAVSAGIQLREFDWSGRAGAWVEWAVAQTGRIAESVLGKDEAKN